MIPVRTVVSIVALCGGAAAHADVLATNLGIPVTTSTFIGETSTTVFKAAGFAIPSSETYRIDSVNLALRFTPGSPGTPEVSIWTGAGAPSAQVAVLNNPAIGGDGNYTFTAPPGGIEIAGGTMWVYVRSPDNIGSFNWDAGATNPVGQLPFFGYNFNGANSTTRNKLQVDGQFVQQCVNFDFLPGADGRLGTTDDTAIAAPGDFASQSPLSNQFLAVSLGFRPASGGIDNRNEILNDASFGFNPGSSPNLLASQVSTDGQIIEIEFTRDVYEVSCILGIGAGRDRILAIGAGGGGLDQAEANRALATVSSASPFRIVRGVALDGGATVSLDNLCYRFAPRFNRCPADLSGSSDPNDPAYGQPDGSVDASDFFYFLDQFTAQNLAVADLSGSSDPNDPGYGVPDGIIDSADFFYYLDLFVGDCP